jgi:hypothetical protein
MSYAQNTGYSTNATTTTTRTSVVNPPAIVTFGYDGNINRVCSSSDGKYAALMNFYSVYTSNNYGQTWNVNTSLGKKAFTGICISETGQYLVCSVNSDYIYTSSDYGVTWITQTSQGIQSWNYIACSSSGKYVIGIAGKNVYVSSNYGQSWSLSLSSQSANNVNLFMCACSADFTTIGACESKYVGDNSLMYLYLSRNNGATWEVSNSTMNGGYKCMSISSTGKYILTGTSSGGVLLSWDNGITYLQVYNTTLSCSTVSVTSNGQYLVAGLSNGLYLSTNMGATWSAISEPYSLNEYMSAKISDSSQYIFAVISGEVNRIVRGGVDVYDLMGISTVNAGYLDIGYKTSPNMSLVTALSSSPNLSWQGIGGSNDGRYLIATAYGSGLYVSSDWGNTWTQSTQTTGNWENVSVSGDGMYALANISANVYRSIDWGNTWALVATAAKPVSKVSVSTNAQYMYFSAYGDKISRSTDFGVTWEARESDRSWGNMSCSADGKYVYAATNNVSPSTNGIYVSSDYGVTFVKTTAPNSAWNGLCVCRNGEMVFAAINGGQVYKTGDYGATWQILSASPSSDWYIMGGSETGKYVVSVSNSFVRVSKDGGATWANVSTANSTLNYSWIPRMGQYVYALTNGGKIQRMGTGANLGDMVACPSGTYTTGYNWKGTDTLAVAYNSGQQWVSVAANQQGGKYVLSCDFVSGTVVMSTNYGVTWAAVSGLPTGSWQRVALSADGRFMYAANFGSTIWWSSNYGSTWTAYNALTANWYGLETSSDGQYVAASYSTNGGIRNFKNGTLQSTYQDASARNMGIVAISSDAMYQYTYDVAYGIYRSTNRGTTFARVNSLVTTWNGIATNATGKYVVAVCANTQPGIYMSYDYGSNWTRVNSLAKTWNRCAMSPNGRIIVANIDAASSGGIYISVDYGRTWAATSAASKGYFGICLCNYGQTMYTTVYNELIYKMTLTMDVGNMLSIESSM